MEENKPVASICHGIEILAAADVIRGKEITTIPRCQLDAELAGATYVSEGLVVSGNLYCCRFKRECALWMKAFVRALDVYGR
jgi:protease I